MDIWLARCSMIAHLDVWALEHIHIIWEVDEDIDYNKPTWNANYSPESNYANHIPAYARNLFSTAERCAVQTIMVFDYIIVVKVQPSGNEDLRTKLFRLGGFFDINGNGLFLRFNNYVRECQTFPFAISTKGFFERCNFIKWNKIDVHFELCEEI